MDIYSSTTTGIFTAQGRECNTFAFTDLNVDFKAQIFTFSVSLFEVEADAINGKEPNNKRSISTPTTTQETLADCVASLFAGSPYELTEETLNLSNATLIN